MASAENTAALESLFDRVVNQILKELAAGVSRPGALRSAAILARITEIAHEINPAKASKLRAWIRREVPNAFILGDKNAVADLKAVFADAEMEKSLASAFNAVNSTSLRAILASMTSKFADVHRQILSTSEYVINRTRLAFNTDAAVRDQVTQGIIRGSAGRTISNDIAKAILKGIVTPDAAKRMQQVGLGGDLELYKQLSEGKLIQVGGKRMNVRTYSNLVAKTMQRQAASVATIVRLQQNGIHHVQVSTTMPTDPDVCSLCAGNVYYIGPGADPEGFPHYSQAPGGGVPMHPNCRHVLRAYVLALKTSDVTDSLRGNVYAAERFFGMDSADASKEIRELVKAGGIAAIEQFNPKLYGKEPAPRKVAPNKGRAA